MSQSVDSAVSAVRPHPEQRSATSPGPPAEWPHAPLAAVRPDHAPDVRGSAGRRAAVRTGAGLPAAGVRSAPGAADIPAEREVRPPARGVLPGPRGDAGAARPRPRRRPSGRRAAHRAHVYGAPASFSRGVAGLSGPWRPPGKGTEPEDPLRQGAEAAVRRWADRAERWWRVP